MSQSGGGRASNSFDAAATLCYANELAGDAFASGVCARSKRKVPMIRNALNRPVARLITMMLSLILLCAVRGAGTQDVERPFLSGNEAAMERMMRAMNVTPTGSVDADFASMMIPHHQGAIDMALLELRYGHNEQLRRISQEIIVDQRQEIIAMRLVVAQRHSAATSAGISATSTHLPAASESPAASENAK
jgi:Domain of unknown function (DUF305)